MPPRWGTSVQVGPAAPPPTRESDAPPERKKHRVFFWVFLAVQLLFLIWLIVGLVSASSAAGCTGLSKEDCEAATGLGATIGAGAIVGFWVAVDFILGVTYLIYRAFKRT